MRHAALAVSHSTSQRRKYRRNVPTFAYRTGNRSIVLRDTLRNAAASSTVSGTSSQAASARGGLTGSESGDVAAGVGLTRTPAIVATVVGRGRPRRLD